MTQLPPLRPVIYGKPSFKPSPSRVSLTESDARSTSTTPALQEAWKAAAEERVRATEAANLRGETRDDERYPSRG